MEKETIIFLEGEKETDHDRIFKQLQNRGYDCRLLNELYYYPEKLKELPTLNPDFLFIATTGIRVDEQKILVSTFDSLKYVPKAVMFWGENSAMTYLGIARELKKAGTKFYFAPNLEGDELEEIIWI
jgi:hypothetical protein